MTAIAVVRADDVPADRPADGVQVRTLLEVGPASQRFVRRLVEVAPRSPHRATAGPAGELWFVLGGAGQLEVQDQPALTLQPDRALWLPPGARYLLDAAEPGALRIDAVSLPAVTTSPGGPEPCARDLADCEVETTGDRQFRVLFGPGRGCSAATQFAGEIPPGKAPHHSHPYDEVVLVLAGTGVLHLDDGHHDLSAGSCAHLPPGQLHCLENTGTTTMRVLGVFHPADSPAAKSHIDQA